MTTPNLVIYHDPRSESALAAGTGAVVVLDAVQGRPPIGRALAGYGLAAREIPQVVEVARKMGGSAAVFHISGAPCGCWEST